MPIASERKRLMRVFEHGLDTPAGFVMPILARKPGRKGRRWRTQRWVFKRDRLFLLPGDSPIGLRLPLASLVELLPLEFPAVLPDDTMGEQTSLPQRHVLDDEPALDAEAAEEAVRTAMAIEARDGHLCIFLPPVANAEDFAALVAAIEQVAAASNQPVYLEGYTPPEDPRLSNIKVTPDPGVIEINVHPATSWEQAVDITSGVYAEAEKVRLAAEKFMLDGRHVGTGGGNHIVLGGITPKDSPFLRRPDLLASIVTYWQNHPSLSYLFSGMFIGPTSQAPRVDEGRHDSLYELEIALQQIPDRDEAITMPWLVDRLFRNLLVDVSGNTHRAEICIDKLYSPEGPTGRLGLVEFRAFEMPPHARMSLAQQLLIRALIARFWEKPYKQPLVRWGTGLHDRFMLPRFVWADFEGVVADLADAGLPVKVGVVPAAPRVPLSGAGCRRARGRAPGAAPGAGAVAGAGRGERGRRHDAAGQLLAGTRAGAGDRGNRRPLRGCLQRLSAAAGRHRDARRSSSRRPLPRLAAAAVPASQHRPARAPDLRRGRHLDRTLDRRLPLSRGASGRPQFRGPAGQCAGGGGTPARPLREHRPHRGRAADTPARRQRRFPPDARSAPCARVTCPVTD